MTKLTAALEMRHITKVRLENFQSHADSTVQLEPGINLITGSSDAGKSAILRGINWVLHNKPNGKGFVRHGASEARVTVWFSDGTTVQRIKGDSRNAVMVKGADGIESAYDRFGNEYPKEVLEALGNPPSDDKHGPIDYAEQMAPYFLVSLTPTELPRILAELTRLDDLQDAADNLAKRSREKERQIKMGQERVDRFEKELESYGSLEGEMARQELLDKRASRVEQLYKKLKSARLLVTQYKELMVQGRAETLARDRAIRVSELVPSVSDLHSKACLLTDMRDLCLEMDSLSVAISDAESSLDTAKVLSSGEVTLNVCGLNEELERISPMRLLSEQYREVLRQGSRAIKERDTALLALKTFREEHEILKACIVDAGLWCAACERPLDDTGDAHAK